MIQTHLRLASVLAIGFGLVGVGAGVLAYRASADEPPVPQQKAPPENAGQRATRLAMAVHTQAAAIDKLPRFSYQVRYRTGVVDSFRAVDASPDRLKEGLTAPVRDKDWIGWYRLEFSWDEKRFLWGLSPIEETIRAGGVALNYDFRFWTADDVWERHEATDKSSRNFVRMAEPAKMFQQLALFDYSYLRLTPHRYWWGQTVGIGNNLTMSRIPPATATWWPVGVEDFAGEACDVVESAQRAERLWIGRDSGRVRGTMTYSSHGPGQPFTFHKTDAAQQIAGRPFGTPEEYQAWYDQATDDQLIKVAIAYQALHPTPFPASYRPSELVRFDDYREVRPGVWLPFREVRTIRYPSGTAKGKAELIRSELLVEEVRTDRSLADRHAELLPKDGDPVQDQRFAVAVNLVHDAKRTDDEIRALADAEYREQLNGEAVFRSAVKPLDALVGKPAPALPADGWVGGKRPELAGKPYLLHFWATTCGPCKGDFPRLKALAESGAVVGMHPRGATAEEVAKEIDRHRLNYPILLAADARDGDKKAAVGGYPLAAMPYCVLVDAQGNVAGHGFLSEVLTKFGSEALIAPPKDNAIRP